MNKERKEKRVKKNTDATPPLKTIEGIYTNLKSRTFIIHPTALVLATYVLLLFTKLIDITLINRENEYFSVVILQMMIFILPGAIWCKFSGEKYMSGLRLRTVKADSILIIISGALLIASGSLLLGVLFGGLESLSNNFSLYDTFISKDQGTIPNKIYLVMAYAVLPAICEEFIYRGILCHEYEKGGVMRAVIVSSIFFALLHFNLQNLPMYLFSGIILAMTLYATRSLFGAVITHFLYNIFGLFGQPYMSNLYQITNSPKLFIFIVAAVCILSAAVFCGEAARLYKIYLYKAYSADYRQPVIKDSTTLRRSYTDIIRQPSAIACFAVYILALIISWL
ncbi:MAG: CPBP family intramembrane metalloprotease [Clostridia bacterium]|nr:CPBP family intramembrane metalloprotease [Clostridia bacterium]